MSAEDEAYFIFLSFFLILPSLPVFHVLSLLAQTLTMVFMHDKAQLAGEMLWLPGAKHTQCSKECCIAIWSHCRA